MALAIMGLMGSADLKADLRSALPFGLPIETIPAPLMGWGTLAISISFILASWYMLGVPGETGGQTLVRVLSGLRIAGSVLGLWVVVVAWGVVIPDLSWSRRLRRW